MSFFGSISIQNSLVNSKKINIHDPDFEIFSDFSYDQSNTRGQIYINIRNKRLVKVYYGWLGVLVHFPKSRNILICFWRVNDILQRMKTCICRFPWWLSTTSISSISYNIVYHSSLNVLSSINISCSPRAVFYGFDSQCSLLPCSYVRIS